MTTWLQSARLLGAIFGASLLMGAAPNALGPSAPDLWQDQSIYQIITDRFFNGDPTNDNAEGNYNPASGEGVHGGDWKGIEQKLDYIKALGATAIWISPVVLNGTGDYHGYAGRDFLKPAPHFGSLEDLKRLIDTAHAKGLLVIDDVVVNHGALLLKSNDPGYPGYKAPPDGYSLSYRNNGVQYAAPFDAASGQSLPALFHNNGFIQNYGDAAQVERGSLLALDDFRTESDYVRAQMVAIYKFWIDQGFDAFRIDTVKHVDHGFWQSWAPQIRQYATAKGKPDFFLFGEVYDGDTKAASYTGTKAGGAFELDSTLDYQLYFSINSVFALANGNTRQIEDHYHAVDALFDLRAQPRLVTFLDNHDQARFLSPANAAGNLARLNVALTFLHTSRGIPALYYGTEQGFNGGADPTNREDMFAGQFEQGPSAGDNFNMTHPEFLTIAKLNNFRRSYPALRRGEHINLWNSPNGPGLFAYARRFEGQEVLVCFNTAPVPLTLNSRPSLYPSGTVLVNLLEPSETITVNAAGEIPAQTVPATTAKMFIAQSQAVPLDPVVTNVTPPHDEKSVPTVGKIVVRFSKPMNKAATEAAFSTSPPTTGSFSWSPNNDQLTYQPDAAFPALSLITVKIAEGATAADGTRFYAPFESRFATAEAQIVDVAPPTITVSSPGDGAALVEEWNQFAGAAQDDNGLGALEVKIDDEPWFVATTMSNSKNYPWYFNLFTAYQPNGLHTFSFRARDTAGNVSSTITRRFRFVNKPGAFKRSFVAGAPGFGDSDCEGKSWGTPYPYAGPRGPGSDGYIGGTFQYSSDPIANVCDRGQFLYRRAHYSVAGDSFRYVFNCPPGQYKVTVHNAETLFTGGGLRLFDVYAQGQKVLSSVNIAADAGGPNRAVTHTFNVTAPNPRLEVQFNPVVEPARMSAIEVEKIADNLSDNDGLPDWWRLAYFNHPTGFAEDKSRAGDDLDGDGKTNFEEFTAGTDPSDAGSVFRITRVRRYYNDNYIAYYAPKGRSYELQFTDNLANPNWQTIRTREGFGYVTEMIDFNGGLRSPVQYYRLVALPP